MTTQLTQEDIERCLSELGLKQGDMVLLHSGLSSLGHVEGGADTVIDAFLHVLGSEGTLVLPHFAPGAVPKAAAERPDAVISVAPTANVSAIGAQAEAICRDHWKADTGHAENTPYMRLAEAGGYVCLLGVDQDRSTLLHTPEEILRLPYLTETKPKEIDTPEGKRTCSFKFFPGPHRDFIGLEHLFRERGIIRTTRIGDAMVRLMKARDLVDACVEAGRRDPAFALCGNPHCAACVRQRAAIRRDRFGRECFQVVASAQLAGRYVEEMIEQCRAAGVDAVELDGVRGKPVDMLKVEEIVEAVNTLTGGKIRVAALRVRTWDNPDALLDKAGAAGVGRVVVPLGPEPAAYVQQAEDKGVSVSFYNTNETGQAVAKCLTELGAARLTLNPVNFARCGQNPFLISYRRGRLRPLTDQLDVEDGLFDGTPAELARGNAEIKELVSILCCTTFDGTMLLGARNQYWGTLVEVAQRFAELLEAI